MKNILTLLVISVLFAGCNKFIDVDEKGKVIPGTVDDMYKLMSDYDGFFFSTANAFLGTDDIRIYEDEVNRMFGISEMFTNGFLWKDYIFANTTDDDRDWNILYAQIYTCNVVLDRVDAAKGSDEALRAKAKGEALAQRAYAYFMLANLYGKHYNEATASADLAVPLYLKPDINAALPRATVKEVYDLVEKDLTQALGLLPDKAEIRYHPSKAGVHGLLARMYLFMGKYELAKTHADAALQIHSFLYDFRVLQHVSESAKFLGIIGFPNRILDNEEQLWHKESNQKLIYLVAVYISDEMRALYEPGDKRLKFTEIETPLFGPNAHGNGIWPKEVLFKCGITTPELYLIRAEANARLSQPGLAIDDLNKLRENRFEASMYVPLDRNQTDLDALKLVLRERRLELFTECWRWFDLKRLNLDPRFQKTMTREWGGKTYTLAPDSKNYVLAIPKKVVQLNPLLEQNPRDQRQ